MELWSAGRVYCKGGFEPDWGVLVDKDGLVDAFGPRAQLVAKAKKVRHYPDSLMMPSVVNPHHHGFHALFRGIAHQQDSYQALLESVIWPLGTCVDYELLEDAYRLAFADQALAGVSHIGEFHYLHNGAFSHQEESDFGRRIIDIALDMGLEITLIYAFFDQGHFEQAKAFIQPVDVSIQRFKSLKERYRHEDRVHILPGIHSLFHTSDEAILAANELAKSYGDKLHIQLAERQRDLEVAESHYGTSPLKAMDKLGCLGDHLVIINGNALTEEEYALAKKHGCQFVLCPVSCMAKGDDVPNFPALVQHELPFTIGSDSASMNQGYSFLNELKWLNFAWRNKQGHFEQWQNCRLCSKIWSLGTEQAMMVLGQVPRSLAPGQFANFILMDISGPAFRPRWNFDREAFTSQLIFGSGRHADVQHLIVRGRTIVKNGSLVSVDLDPHYRHLDQWCNAYMQTLD